MKILTATCRDGSIRLPAGSVAEGAKVTILVPEEESTFTLSPDESRRLTASIDQASRGEVVDGWELLEQL